MIWPRSVRDVAVLLVNTVARLADKTITAWPNVTGGDDD